MSHTSTKSHELILLLFLGIFGSFNNLNALSLLSIQPLLSAPAWIFCIALVLINYKKYQVLVNHSIVSAIFILAVLITLISISMNPLEIRGENTLLKAAKAIFYLILMCLSFFAGSIAAQKSRVLINVVGITALTTTLFGIYLDRYGAFDLTNVSVIHINQNLLYRIRGFSDEPGTLALIVVVAFALSSYGKINLIFRFTISVLFTFTLLIIESRALIPGSIAAAVIVLYLRSNRVKRLKAIAILVVSFLLVVGSVSLNWILSQSIWASLSRPDSDTVRIIWSLVAASIMVSNPLGCGFAGTLTCVPEKLNQVSQSNWILTQNVDWREISRLYYSNSDFALSPTNLLGLLVVYMGIPGFIIGILFIAKILKCVFNGERPKEMILFNYFVTLVIILSLFSTSRLTTWLLFFLFGAIMSDRALRIK
jgi:hypothetical protein